MVKIAQVIGTSMLGLVLGTIPFANAQHSHEGGQRADSQKQHGKEGREDHGRSSAPQHSERHEPRGLEQRHEPRAQEQPRVYGNKQRMEPSHRGQGASYAREASRHDRDEHSGPGDVWQGHRAQHWDREHRGWRERGGYRGYRIPEDRFRAHFGRGHWFRVHSVPTVVVGGNPRFQYGGFWFSVVDPWPEYWSRTWYETDDVYVDYGNDGYYMYNRSHPGIAIAVNVSF